MVGHSPTDSNGFITWEQFAQVDLRVGEIVEVQGFPRARHPAYKVRVHFGEAIGHRWSAAQLTHYEPAALIGRRVLAVINFPPKNVAGFQSECLICGVPDAQGRAILLSPTHDVPLGGKLF